MALQPTGPAWMFCPADRPDRFEKAASTADIVILDLEDGVAPRNREAARQALVESRLEASKTVIRISPAGTQDQQRDLVALARTAYTTVMLAKTESATHVAELAPYEVVVLVETPLGALAVNQTAQTENTCAVMWGADDLIAGLGGTHNRSPGGSYREVISHVRSQVLLAAKAYNKLALDAVFTEIRNGEALRKEVDDAAAVGFDGKAAIHPAQVPIIRSGFRPSAEQLAWAQRVISAAGDQRGAFEFEGFMVDAPILVRAERVIRAAYGPA